MMILNFKSKDFHLSFIYYAKNYGRLTRVTRLKVAENMADPTRLLERPRTLKGVETKQRRSQLPSTRAAWENLLTFAFSSRFSLPNFSSFSDFCWIFPFSRFLDRISPIFTNFCHFFPFVAGVLCSPCPGTGYATKKKKRCLYSSSKMYFDCFITQSIKRLSSFTNKWYVVPGRSSYFAFLPWFTYM